MKTHLASGLVLFLIAGCAGHREAVRVENLFQGAHDGALVTVIGCVVSDPMAYSGNHAFLSSRCDIEIDGEYPSGLRELSIDLVPAHGRLAEGIFRQVQGCRIIRGRFIRYADGLEEGAVPSGSLMSGYGLIEVEAIGESAVCRRWSGS